MVAQQSRLVGSIPRQLPLSSALSKTPLGDLPRTREIHLLSTQVPAGEQSAASEPVVSTQREKSVESPSTKMPMNWELGSFPYHKLLISFDHFLVGKFMEFGKYHELP